MRPAKRAEPSAPARPPADPVILLGLTVLGAGIAAGVAAYLTISVFAFAHLATPRSGASAIVHGLRALADQPGRPRLAFPLEARILPASPVVFWIVALLVALIVLAPFAYSFLTLSAPSGPSRRVFRRAPFFAGRERTRRRRPAQGRLILGRVSRLEIWQAPRETHLLVCAPPGEGKSSTLVIPNLLCWDGPAVSVSTKRDVLDATGHARAQRGPVYVFDPLSANCTPWSPVDGCEAWDDALRRADALRTAGGTQTSSSVSEFWEQVASELLAALLYAANHTGRSVGEVFEWVSREELDEPRRLLQDAHPGGAAPALAALDAASARPAQYRASTFVTLQHLLRAYRYEQVRANARSGFQPEMLFSERPGTLFIVASEEEQTLLAPVVTALLDTVYRYAQKRSACLAAALSPPLLLALDETANIAPLRELPSMLSQSRSHGIVFLTCWQSLAQIRDRYRQGADTILAASRTKAFLPGSTDEATLDYLRRLTGARVATDEDIRVPRGRMLIAHRDEQPFLVTPRPWFRDRHLQRLAGRRP